MVGLCVGICEASSGPRLLGETSLVGQREDRRGKLGPISALAPEHVHMHVVN